jgi:hypothetical protein
MTLHDDDEDARFDLNRLRPTPEDVEAHAAARRALKKSKGRGTTAAGRLIGHGPFVRYPVEAIHLIGAAKNAGTAKLFPLLLHLDWKADHRPFRLSNEALALLGISRGRKGPVLRELEQMGLIRVEHRTRKSPLITVLVSSKRGRAG